MKATLKRYYNDICARKYRCLGFIKNKMTFARIRGDVLQSFSMKCFQGIPVCTIEFGIFPLCMPTPIFIEAGGYRLDKFIVEISEKNAGWLFEPNIDNSMKKCIESIAQAIDSYLLPFFNACNDCSSSLYELMKLDELFECNRQKILTLRGETDCAIPWKERAMFDSRKYYMALRSKDLSFAAQYLHQQIACCKKKLASFDNPTSPRQPKGVKEGITERLVGHMNDLKQLESGNLGYFDERLRFNEKQMRTYIMARYPNVWKNSDNFAP